MNKASKDFAAIIKELMTRYNEKRRQWITYYGTDEGFNDWFTKQIMGMQNDT